MLLLLPHWYAMNSDLPVANQSNVCEIWWNATLGNSSHHLEQPVSSEMSSWLHIAVFSFFLSFHFPFVSLKVTLKTFSFFFPHNDLKSTAVWHPNLWCQLCGISLKPNIWQHCTGNSLVLEMLSFLNISEMERENIIWQVPQR